MRDRGELPPHLIRRRDVAAWLRGSAVTAVLTHRTTPEAAAALRATGEWFSYADPTSRFGFGFYAATRPEATYGTAALLVAIRLMNPLGPLDSIDLEDAISDLEVRFGSEDRREVVLRAGYDGLVVRFGPGDEWAIAYHADQVRIVVEG